MKERQWAAWVGKSLAAAALVLLSKTTAAPMEPAASMRDLRDHFAACFQPPGTANTRVTFYFSLDAHGGLIGRPRTTWLGFNGSAEERAKRLADFTEAFRKCLPVALAPRMAAGIPGEVYFLQFVVGAEGREQQVLLRPFGSHGGLGPLGPGPGSLQTPGLPDAQGPDVSGFKPFRPQPGQGPFFHPPIALPSRAR